MMSAPIIVWFRNDLRLHDHPALAAAARTGAAVVPVFVLNTRLLHGSHAGSNRNRFLLECLTDLRDGLRRLGADLVVREGEPAQVLAGLAAETQAQAVYYTADYTPYAVRRDQRVKHALEQTGIEFRSFGGRLVVDSLDMLHTQTGKPHKVFTPFWKNWQRIERRPLAPKPSQLVLPPGIHPGTLPAVAAVTRASDLSAQAMSGGETAGRARMQGWVRHGVRHYHELHDQLSQAGTSQLSPYLHFGCISARELEESLPDGMGAEAFDRQLAWRDFYQYVLYHFPQNAGQEFQERYRAMPWGTDATLLQAWQQGRTGYPIVDACMRQLNQEGWMHNRGRLIVGSFLTKDLWLDWRLGEAYFMRMLVDGDEANNNGNWQWIASVGVDPAPVFRRLYNPTLQGERYDADGSFVRRYVPELKNVPFKYLAEPWKMPPDEQRESGCLIGKDYPAPVVDHAEARQYALKQYRQTAAGHTSTA